MEREHGTTHGGTVTRRASGPTLAQIRGSIKPGRANARSVAALADNPGCSRRRVLEAAAVPLYEVAHRAGFESGRGQSPFAISSGVTFEAGLKRRSGYKKLAEAVNQFIDLPAKPRIQDLSSGEGQLGSQKWLDSRVAKTDEALRAMATGSKKAPHIVDHPMLTFIGGGATAYLEPDALAFRVDGELELVEIKSFPIIDGQADGTKVSAMAGQSAVYVLALRQALERMGLDPELVRWSVILVAPQNFGRFAAAHRVPLRKKAQSILRVLDRTESVGALLAELPAGFTIDVGSSSSEEQAQKLTTTQLRQLTPRYVPECLSSCDLAQFCRAEAVEVDDPGRLGRAAHDTLGDVRAVQRALDIARGKRLKLDEAEKDVADSLRSAYDAVTRARSAVPAAVKLDSVPRKSR